MELLPEVEVWSADVVFGLATAMKLREILTPTQPPVGTLTISDYLNKFKRKKGYLVITKKNQPCTHKRVGAAGERQQTEAVQHAARQRAVEAAPEEVTRSHNHHPRRLV